MSGALLIPPGHDLIKEISGRLESHDKDYSGSLIIFTGKRPGYYLRKELGSECGSGFIPPHIMSMDEFVDYVYTELLKINDRKIDVLDAAAILFDIHNSAAEPIGGEHFKRIDDFLPLAMNIFKELEEFCIADISTGRLQEAISGYDTGQVGALDTYYKKFYELLEARHYSTRSIRYREVARSIKKVNLDIFRKVFFGGFFVLTQSERKIFTELIVRKNVLMLFQDGKGIREHLNELNIEPEVIGEATGTPKVRFHKSPDTHGQVLALSNLVSEKINEGAALDENNVIVTPAPETLFPLIQHTLPLIPDNDSNISLGYPAARSTLHGFLNAVIDTFISRENGRYYAHDYLRFALHPYTKNILLENASEPTRILFHAIEDHFMQNATLTYFDLSELEADTKLIERIRARITGAGYSLSVSDLQNHLRHIHDTTIRPLENVSSMNDFATKLTNIIIFVHEHSTARQHPLFNHFSGHIIEALNTLRNSLLADVKFNETTAYFNFYRHYIETVQIPFSGTPLSGLQILGFLETRSLKFNRVFFLDANDDVITAMRNDEPLVPVRVRMTLGIPTYYDRERLHIYYLDLLVNNAREVDFFYIEKDKKERSRYLEQLAWQTEKSGEEIPTDSIQYAIRLNNPEPDAIPKTTETIEYLKKMKFSATSLDTYLKCQLRFYYRYVLKLREREELVEDIDALQIGSIVHDILKRYFSNRKGYQLSEQDLPVDEMNSRVDEVFHEMYGEELWGKSYILHRQVKRRMQNFLYKYQIPITNKEPVQLIDVELPLEAHHNGFQLSGKLDRVEKRSETVCIVDYKISSNVDRLKIRLDKLDIDDRSTWYDAIGSLQLPVYMILYENNLEEKASALNTLFLLLGKQHISMDIEHSLMDSMDSPEVDIKTLKSILSKLLDEIIDPSFDFAPTEDFSTECANCPYTYICGTQWAK